MSTSNPKYKVSLGPAGWTVHEWDGKHWTWASSFTTEFAAVGYVKDKAKIAKEKALSTTYYDEEGAQTDARR